jgi:hypothetical protein
MFLSVDIATIEAEDKGKGNFTKFLIEIEKFAFSNNLIVLIETLVILI